MGCSSSNIMDENVFKFEKKSLEELSLLKVNFLEKQKAIYDLERIIDFSMKNLNQFTL